MGSVHHSPKYCLPARQSILYHNQLLQLCPICKCKIWHILYVTKSINQYQGWHCHLHIERFINITYIHYLDTWRDKIITCMKCPYTICVHILQKPLWWILYGVMLWIYMLIFLNICFICICTVILLKQDAYKNDICEHYFFPINFEDVL